MRIVGVDGCRSGWVAATYDAGSWDLCVRVHGTLAEIASEYEDASCIAVDIPIGLPEGEPRLCDIEARRVLGPKRSSVFPAPERHLLEAVVSEDADYDRANELSREISGKGISKQSFAIIPKIAEADLFIAPDLQEKVIEVHPEVSFRALAGHPMVRRKSTSEGFDERRDHLARAFGGVHIPSRTEARRMAPPAKPDDLLDAIVAAWTAKRFAEGNAERLPAKAHTDSRGLRMEIVY